VRCHASGYSEVNPVRRWLGVEHGDVSLGLERAQRQDQRVVDMHIAPYDDVAYTGERI
jgi:hypothetical protein